MQKSILITGCSSGIGLKAAEILHQKGYRVFATVRKQADLHKLASLGLDAMLLDLADSQSIYHAVNTILGKTGGTLDALFNNAGFVQAGAVEDLTREMIREQFETNVFGTMELTNLILPIMRRQGHGRIIQNTSILGIITMPYRGAYSASKFALEGFSHTLRQELRNTNIFVSMIAPGPIHSELRHNAHHHYQAHLREKPSVHQDVYQKMEKHFFNVSASRRPFTLKPDAVVTQVLRALEDKHPKAHYYVSFSAHLFAFLRRILPDKALDWVIHQVNRGEMSP